MGQRERAAYVDHCAADPAAWQEAHGLPGGWDGERARLYAACTPLDVAMVQLSRHEAEREASRRRSSTLLSEIEEHLAAVAAGIMPPLTPADRATLIRADALSRAYLERPDTRGDWLREEVAAVRGQRLIRRTPRPAPRPVDTFAARKRAHRAARDLSGSPALFDAYHPAPVRTAAEGEAPPRPPRRPEPGSYRKRMLRKARRAVAQADAYPLKPGPWTPGRVQKMHARLLARQRALVAAADLADAEGGARE